MDAHGRAFAEVDPPCSAFSPDSVTLVIRVSQITVTAAKVIQMSATLKTANQGTEEVDDMAVERPGFTEQAIEEVAGDAGQQ